MSEPIRPGRRAWELVRCTGCEHEHVRPACGRLLLPCGYCRSETEALPMFVNEQGSGTFALGDVAPALEWATTRERELAITSTNSYAERHVHSERASAFGEALEMVRMATASEATA